MSPLRQEGAMQAEPLPGRGGIALGLDNLDLTLQFLMTRYAHRR